MDGAGREVPPPPERTTFREEVRSRRGPSRGRILGRVAFLAVALVSLYILWPSLLKLFSAWPQLLRISPIWLLVMIAAEGASFACQWALVRIVLGTSRWAAIATAQLAGNAFSRIVPGGAAAGGALQYRMLTQSGFEPARVGAALTASSLISTATIFALPLLAVPAVLLGAPVARGLVQATWLGAGACALFLSVGAALLLRDRPLLMLSRALRWAMRKLPGEHREIEDLPERLLRQRNDIRRELGADWWRALLAAGGNWGLDYLALLAAITAVGARPRPSLVLLAYVTSIVLSFIPITPGGLGFVEAGLTATLALAGVSAADAVLATLAYRLVSYWLPILIGPLAYWLHTSRIHRPAGASPAEG